MATHTLTNPKAAYQGYQILHIGYSILPLLAGIDKYTQILTHWEQYIAPVLPNTIGISVPMFARGAGIIEIIAGILVAAVPKIGAYVVMVWLLLIVINLVILSGFYDIAARDLILAIGAAALGRLAAAYTTSQVKRK